MKLSKLTARRSKLYRMLAVAMTIGMLTSVMFAGAVTATDGPLVEPILFNDGPGGNTTCADVGDYEFSSERVNYDEDTGLFDQAFPDGIDVDTDGTSVSFTSTFGIGAVIVKGGPNSNVYVYDPQVTSDSGLTAPINSNNDKPYGLSNLTFCWNPEPVEEGEWCSPGYWRQAHHLDSWEATGISPDELYSEYFGAISLSKKAVSDGANSNPTLWEVLQSPQWYGGDAFNNVGDLLSAAHPDVNFIGERVEDSCPLN